MGKNKARVTREVKIFFNLKKQHNERACLT